LPSWLAGNEPPPINRDKVLSVSCARSHESRGVAQVERDGVVARRGRRQRQLLGAVFA
jgi:hypothetical protein